MRRAPMRGYAMLALWLGLLTGCAAQFSPGTVRQEIVRQRGQEPLGVFELNIGPFTTLLLRNTLAVPAGEVPFAGLRELQLAVFEAPAAQDPIIDVTRVATRGWDPVVKVHDKLRSGMVLLRGDRSVSSVAPDAAIGDLVVIGAGQRSVVYVRLKGRLSPKLPAALGDAVRRGPDAIHDMMMGLSDDASGD